MLRERAKLASSLLSLCDLSVIVASFLTAYWVRSNFVISPHGQLHPLIDYLWLIILVVPIWLLLLYYFGLYESYRTKTVWMELQHLLKTTLFGVAGAGMAVFVLQLHFVSRLLIVLFGVMAFVSLAATRIGIRTTIKAFRRKGFNYRNIVIVGTGQPAKDLIETVKSRTEWGLRLIGVVAENESQAPDIEGYPALGGINDISQLLQRYVIDEVFIAVSPGHLAKIDIVLTKCQQVGVSVRIMVNLFSNTTASISLDNLGPIPLLSFTTTPQNHLMLALKRGFDIFSSSAALILFAPFWILIVAGIKLSSPGPAVFSQTRVSLNGRLFLMYKFRSMYVDAEEKRNELLDLNEVKGPAFKIDNDPRVTALGRFLRKTSLDEIPQLVNVLKGDMSIIGPRPPLPEEVQKYEGWQRRRLSMKPGLTGLWQVNGRSNIRDFDQWMRLDLQYVDNWSLKMDFQILLKTIPVVILGRGAH